MSDPSNSSSSGPEPWGPPPSSHPYGQSSPYGQSDHYGQSDPYGQSDHYGQSDPYGQSAVTEPPPSRPGTVVAAGVITLVLSGLVALLSALLTIALFLARGEVVAEIDRALSSEPGAEGVSASALTDGALVIVLVMLVWSVAACVLGVLVMRGQGWARVLLVISATITAVVSLFAILSLVSAVPMIAAVAVIVLLFTGGANRWFASQRDPGVEPRRRPTMLGR